MFLLCTGVLSFSAFTFADEPKNMCYNSSCSGPEEEIWAGFEANQFPKALSDWPAAVYSGPCYHTGAQYDNRDMHYGVAYVSLGQEETPLLHYSGQFGFFYPEDPYANWTVEIAKQKYSDHLAKNNVIVPEGESGFADFSSPETRWTYYFRTSPDLQKLYVIGFWGSSHFVYCAWDRHQN